MSAQVAEVGAVIFGFAGLTVGSFLGGERLLLWWEARRRG